MVILMKGLVLRGGVVASGRWPAGLIDETGNKSGCPELPGLL